MLVKQKVPMMVKKMNTKMALLMPSYLVEMMVPAKVSLMESEIALSMEETKVVMIEVKMNYNKLYEGED